MICGAKPSQTDSQSYSAIRLPTLTEKTPFGVCNRKAGCAGSPPVREKLAASLNLPQPSSGTQVLTQFDGQASLGARARDGATGRATYGATIGTSTELGVATSISGARTSV